MNVLTAGVAALPAMEAGTNEHAANLGDRVGKFSDLVPLGEEGLEAEAWVGLPVDHGFWLAWLFGPTFDLV
jgi:hypothetical protein